MIVFPRGLILSAPAGYPLTNPPIGWQNLARSDSIDSNDVTVSSELTTGPRDAPLRPDTAEYWQASSMPATWKVDLGSQVSVDYVGIAGHTLGSDAASVLVETSPDGVDGSPGTWQNFAAEFMPADDAPIMFLNDLRTTRYIKLTVSGSGDVPKIAVFYVGAALAMARPIYGGHVPISLSRNTALSQTMSRGGQFLGQGFKRLGVRSSAAFRHLTASWYRANFDPFVKSARRYPYFFAWRPEDFPEEVAYAWTPNDIAPSNMGIRDFMQVSFEIVGIGNE